MFSLENHALDGAFIIDIKSLITVRLIKLIRVRAREKKQAPGVPALCFAFVFYSRIVPSVAIVTTCQGIILPLLRSALLTACSIPPQQGTSMRTTVTLWMSL